MLSDVSKLCTRSVHREIWLLMISISTARVVPLQQIWSKIEIRGNESQTCMPQQWNVPPIKLNWCIQEIYLCTKTNVNTDNIPYYQEIFPARKKLSWCSIKIKIKIKESHPSHISGGICISVFSGEIFSNEYLIFHPNAGIHPRSNYNGNIEIPAGFTLTFHDVFIFCDRFRGRFSILTVVRHSNE